MRAIEKSVYTSESNPPLSLYHASRLYTPTPSTRTHPRLSPPLHAYPPLSLSLLANHIIRLPCRLRLSQGIPKHQLIDTQLLQLLLLHLYLRICRELPLT